MRNNKKVDLKVVRKIRDMKERGLTQDECAAVIGISKSTIDRVTTTMRYVEAKEWDKLKKFLSYTNVSTTILEAVEKTLSIKIPAHVFEEEVPEQKAKPETGQEPEAGEVKKEEPAQAPPAASADNSSNAAFVNVNLTRLCDKLGTICLCQERMIRKNTEAISSLQTGLAEIACAISDLRMEIAKTGTTKTDAGAGTDLGKESMAQIESMIERQTKRIEENMNANFDVVTTQYLDKTRESLKTIAKKTGKYNGNAMIAG